MNPNAAIRQILDGRAYVHCVSAEAVKLRYDQNVAFLHPTEQVCEPRPLLCADATRNAFCYDPSLVDIEPRHLDLSELVSCRLIGGANAGICKGSRHILFERVRKGCPNHNICPKLVNPYFRTCLCAHVRKGSVSDSLVCAFGRRFEMSSVNWRLRSSGQHTLDCRNYRVPRVVGEADSAPFRCHSLPDACGTLENSIADEAGPSVEVWI